MIRKSLYKTLRSESKIPLGSLIRYFGISIASSYCIFGFGERAFFAQNAITVNGLDFNFLNE